MSTQIVMPIAMLALAAVVWVRPAQAHSWYPRECCHDDDCTPVEGATWVVPAGGGRPQLLVSSKKFGTVVIPEGLTPRPSQDSHKHICVAYSEFGDKDVLCFFVPPSM